MSDSSVGTADRAVPTTTTVNESSVAPSLGRALEMCDRALDVMDELQRAGTVDPDFQAAVAAVQAVRTELAECVTSAPNGTTDPGTNAGEDVAERPD
jgi:hypothetical protein